MLSFSEILWGGDLNSSRYFFFVVVGVIMPLKTKVGDVWKDALALKVKVSSQWKPVTQLWSRRNGGVDSRTRCRGDSFYQHGGSRWC